ncbi:hypothetical protein SFUMM280S_09324 [Streptomyces fumanus]
MPGQQNAAGHVDAVGQPLGAVRARPVQALDPLCGAQVGREGVPDVAAVERPDGTGQCVEPPAGIGEALEGAVLVTGPRPLQSRLLRGVDVPAQLPRRLAVRSYGVQVLGKLGGPVLVGIGVLCQHARRGRRGGGVGDARCVRRGRGRGCPAERVLAEGTRRGQCRQHAGVRGRFRREPDLARLGQDRFRRPVRCRRGQVVKGVQHGVGGGLDVGERLGRRRQNLVEARLLAVALGGGWANPAPWRSCWARASGLSGETAAWPRRR